MLRYKGNGFLCCSRFDVKAICIPFVKGESVLEGVKNVHLTLILNNKKYGSVKAGQEIGEIQVTLGEFLLDTIPLVADRTTTETNVIFRLADKLSSML